MTSNHFDWSICLGLVQYSLYLFRCYSPPYTNKIVNPLDARSSSRDPYSSKGPSLERGYGNQSSYDRGGGGSRAGSQHRSQDRNSSQHRNSSQQRNIPPMQPPAAFAPPAPVKVAPPHGGFQTYDAPAAAPAAYEPPIPELSEGALERKVMSLLEEYNEGYSKVADCCKEIASVVPVKDRTKVVLTW